MYRTQASACNCTGRLAHNLMQRLVKGLARKILQASVGELKKNGDQSKHLISSNLWKHKQKHHVKNANSSVYGDAHAGVNATSYLRALWRICIAMRKMHGHLRQWHRLPSCTRSDALVAQDTRWNVKNSRAFSLLTFISTWQNRIVYRTKTRI